MNTPRHEAMILDLDGVITDTARLHSRAWKQALDDFLKRRAESEGAAFVPFDEERDYLAHVDGKPRYDGVRDFLASRRIELPWGDPSDPPGAETVCGVGNSKNVLFSEIIDRDGVEVFDDADRQIRRWRGEGLKLGLVTSSRNGARILRAAGLEEFFDARVDGEDAARLGLPGKPAPDTFLEAARRLGVDPGRAVVFEDALSGVEAGRAGGFAVVVGVGRHPEMPPFERHGADCVVRSLDEFEPLGETG